MLFTCDAASGSHSRPAVDAGYINVQHDAGRRACVVQLRAYVFAVLQHSELCRCYQPAPGYSTDGRLCTCAWSAFLAEPVYASPMVEMAFVVAGLMIIDGRVLRRLRSSKGDMLDEGLARGLDVARGR